MENAMKLFFYAINAVVLVTFRIASAGDFDGSKLLICAPVEAMDCVSGEDCTKGRPSDICAPAVLRVDFANKAIIGPNTTMPMLFVDKAVEQILRQGKGLEY